MTYFCKVLVLAFPFYILLAVCDGSEPRKAKVLPQNRLLGRNLFKTTCQSIQPPHLLESIHHRADRREGRFRYRVIPSEKVEKNLARFIGLLQSFITDSCFDSAGFLAYEKSLKASLDDLHHQYDHCDTVNKIIKNSLGFAQTVFQDMKWTAAAMNHLDLAGNTDQSIVHKLVQLNVRLYALFDVQGRPDIYISGYSGTINKFRLTIELWCKLLGNFQGVTLVRRIQFEYLYARAEEMLQTLTEAISG